MLKALVAILGAAIVIALVVYYLRSRGRSAPKQSPTEEKSYPAPVPTYVDLRNQVFHGVREHLQLPPDFDPTEPFAVVMDWGSEPGVVTVVALEDGTASIYYSSGGGMIGGSQSYESIRAAAKLAVSEAARCRHQMTLTTTFPTPCRGQVYFYALTDSGTYFATGTQQELEENRHPLSGLGNAMQTIISAYDASDK